MPFWDYYLPDKLAGVGFVSAPRTRTTIQVDSGGGEDVNQEWEHPLMRFVAPEATRNWAVVRDLSKHWRLTAGPYRSFPLRDPQDFASCDLVRPNVVPAVTMLDQSLGTGDGFTDRFQIKKRYELGGLTYDRLIYLPVLSTVLVANNGVLMSAADYTVSRRADGVLGGEVLFDVPPLAGHVLTIGFLFDCEVRFESDDQLEQIMRATKVAGFADLTLIEKRPC